MPSSEGQGPMVWSGVPAGEAAPPKAAEIDLLGVIKDLTPWE